MAKHFSNDNFDNEVLKSETPVLVDFFAEWCGPCKMLAPSIDALSKEFEGKVSIGKVDIDKDPNLAEKYQVMSVPTLLFIKNGEVVHRQSGVMPIEKLRNEIQNNLLR